MHDFLEQIYNILNDRINPQIKEIYKNLSEQNMDEKSIDKAYVDIIFLLYSFFKERYETIVKFGLISDNLNEEKIKGKADELLQNYFKYDNSSALNKNYIFESFKNINKELLNSKQIFNNLPKEQKNQLF